jgi:hypothetical protein
MPRRHLRMLRAVVRIELQEGLDESAALVRESELLQTLRPNFNRAERGDLHPVTSRGAVLSSRFG